MKKLLLISMLLLPLTAFAGDLPDPKLTPGDTVKVDLSTLCTPGYSASVRHVSGKIKHKVYQEYGITSHRSGEYEVDHLISLELGGSNDIKNLWPESYETTPYNAHIKDKLENRLHKLVCDGKLPLEQAQKEIATDWVASYKNHVLQ